MIIEIEKSDNGYFVNYWDYIHGNDICCEIIDEKIFLSGDDGKKEILVNDFWNLIKERIE